MSVDRDARNIHLRFTENVATEHVPLIFRGNLLSYRLFELWGTSPARK